MLNDTFGVRVVPRPLPVSEFISRVRPAFVVAIPVRDEEERLPACLRAFALQRDRLGGSISANARSHRDICQQLQRSECKSRSKVRSASFA